MAHNCELRTGYISAYDQARHMARVIFPDKGNLVSGWLPVSVRNSLKNHDEHHLDINEHVACIFNGNGLEEGIIISALYDDKNKPPESDSNIRKILFEDGSVITYDRGSHKETHLYNDGTEISYNAGTGEFKATFAGGESLSYDKSSRQVKINGGGGSEILLDDNRVMLQDHWGSYIHMENDKIEIRAHTIDIQEV